MKNMIDFLFKTYERVRYAAVYKNQELLFEQKKGSVKNSSGEESDKYEELLVNPTILTLARQRGNIDCGGLNFIIISYGNFYQLIKEIPHGHISICLERSSDLNLLPNKIFTDLYANFSQLFS